MKILFLNPHLDAGHKVAKGFRGRGVAVLVSPDPVEAWQMLQLHDSSVDLVVAHRESLGGRGEPGFQLIQQMKQDPQFADVPIILTTEAWSDAECAQHQQGPSGLNAYIAWTVDPQEFLSNIAGTAEAVLGRSVGDDPSRLIAGQAPKSAVVSAAAPTDFPVLEDLSQVFSASSGDSVDLDIKLDFPPLSEDQSIPTAETLSPLELSSSDSGVTLSLANEPPGEIVDNAGVQVLAEKESVELSGEPQEPPFVELPYLFKSSAAERSVRSRPSTAWDQPLGDAVVPGGAAHTPDTETLKKYLLLREQDVAALSAQLKTAQAQARVLDHELRETKYSSAESGSLVESQKKKIDEFEKERVILMDGMQSEVNEVRFQLKSKVDRARILESQVRAATDEMERLKDRVRSDIRKIRVREKELENRLEIVKKDSEVLIATRESKIIELKRKIDLLEFNMDLMQDQFAKEKNHSANLKDRLSKAAQAVRVAGGLLDSKGQPIAAGADDDSSTASLISDDEKDREAS